MSVDFCHHSCFQHSLGRSIRSRNAIHRIYHYFQCWHIQRHSRVAQQRILQAIGRQVALRDRFTFLIITNHISLYQVILCLAMCLTDSQRFSVLRTQRTAEEGAVHIFIAVGINRSGCSIESHSTSIRIEHGSLTDIVFHSIIRHDITGCSHPEREIGILEIVEIRQFHHLLVRQLTCTGVTGIVHNQGTISLLLFNDTGGFRIGIAHRRSGALVSIPHHLLDLEIWIFVGNEISHFVSILHVEIVITVISHKHQCVLP